LKPDKETICNKAIRSINLPISKKSDLFQEPSILCSQGQEIFLKSLYFRAEDNGPLKFTLIQKVFVFYCIFNSYFHDFQSSYFLTRQNMFFY
jgi:hypothetical protein